MDFFQLLFIGVGFVALLLIFLDIRMRKSYQTKRLVEDRPGYPPVMPSTGSPLVTTLGFFYHLFKGDFISGQLERTHKQMVVRRATPCRMVQTQFLHLKIISTWSPDVAKQILLDREDNFVKPKTFGGEFVALVKDSILQVEGQEWKRQKQIIGPAFHYEHLQGLIPRFNEIAQNLAEGWKPTAMDRTPIDITRWINLATLDGLGLAGFGYDFHALEELTMNKKNHKFECYDTMVKSIENPLHVIVPGYSDLPFESNIKLKQAFKDFKEFILEIIREKQKRHLQEGSGSSNSSNSSSSDSLEKLSQQGDADLLDLMVSAHDNGSRLNDEELLANVNTFFIAGHETITGCLTMALHMLAHNPECQEKARQEVDKVLKGELPTYESVKELRYINAVLQETLRMYPPASIMTRQTSRDVVLDGYAVEAGVFINILIWSMQRHEENWVEPETFKPERFLDRQGAQKMFTYLPFSSGARQCIGNNFATLEMKVLMAVLLQRYVFVKDPAPKVPFVVEAKLNMVPRKGHTLLIEMRKDC